MGRFRGPGTHLFMAATVAGIGIPASIISVRYRGAFRYRTGSPYSGNGLIPASVSLFIMEPGLTGCCTFRYSGILINSMNLVTVQQSSEVVS
jgi:hypothetical protein